MVQLWSWNKMKDSQRPNLLKDYVASGKVMQLATIDSQAPWVCHVWYAIDWPQHRLLFTSNPIRNHSKQIAANRNVAGGILSMTLKELGQKVQGVSFVGTAQIVVDANLKRSVGIFMKRWPKAGLDPVKIRRNEIASRLYEINVTKWIFHDELSFPNDPRYELVPSRTA